jgi:23S rRNA pseudouridine2457 synthase
MANRYFIVHKPCNMVSQFVSTDKVGLLGDLDFNFPGGTHAIGRLDNLSEGLLILTTNKKITRLLFQGITPHKRVYLVQVKNIVTEETLSRLRSGIQIRVKGGEKYLTAPCEADIIESQEKNFPPANGFINYPPFTWLCIGLFEGKFHQVRKMVAAVNHKCLRLIRVAIEDLSLDNLPPGEVKEIPEDEFFKKLRI